MRCSVFIATSLDGFIARRDGSLDWLPKPGDASLAGEDHGYDAFIADVDAIVMGRNSFDVVLASGWRYSRPIYVLTHRPLPPIPEGVQAQAVAGTPREVVAALATRGHRHLYVDGGATLTQFLEAGLIERMTLTSVPVLLGDGIRLFGRLSEEVPWRHVRTTSFPSGLVTSVYERP